MRWQTQFVGYKIIEREKVSTPEYTDAYEVEMEKEGSVLEIRLDETGKILEEAMLEQDDDQ